jgi:uncharacterized protein (TIGR00369 family)
MSDQSGLDLLNSYIKAGHWSAMSELLNMNVIAAGIGTATIEAYPSEKFYNPQLRVHGGYAATLIDTALGCAIQSKLPSGVGFGTIELKVNYVRKIVAETGRLVCVGTVLHGGRTMLTAEAKVAGPDGKLYAHGSGTFLVYP